MDFEEFRDRALEIGGKAVAPMVPGALAKRASRYFDVGNKRDRLRYMAEGEYRPKFLERLKWGLYDLVDRAVMAIPCVGADLATICAPVATAIAAEGCSSGVRAGLTAGVALGATVLRQVAYHAIGRDIEKFEGDIEEYRERIELRDIEDQIEASVRKLDSMQRAEEKGDGRFKKLIGRCGEKLRGLIDRYYDVAIGMGVPEL
jgi:hypothetical protein